MDKQLSHLPLAIISVILSGLIFGLLGYWYGTDVNSSTPISTASPTTSASASPIAAVSSAPTATPTPVPYLTGSQLLNFTYKDLMTGKSHALINGTATYSVPAGTGSLTIIQNGVGAQGGGDIDGDGVADRIVLLSENYGGTLTGTDIAAVLNKNGQPVLADEVSVFGDRDAVDSITINNSVITVTGRIHSPSQSLSDAANQPATLTYKLISGKLVKQ